MLARQLSVFLFIGSCLAHILLGYLLLGLISSLVFRALRDNLRHDPRTQEKILFASFTALALADVCFQCHLSLSVLTDIRSASMSGHALYLVRNSDYDFSIAVTILALPGDLQSDFFTWNSMTHGNITFVIFLLSARCIF
jgi:hypothetical protein